ncbi:EamA family transporter [Flavobacterium quisquiliarum]|uniref:DMT family transporter n=1 Tax=Flavobacterium quisquiliarum TaxID=1834436 RepID=A0ABV8W3D5_9FLAO|nr:DMT family transporter [Flavobacterium quisquiliarum]MBW1656909.1 EamA family transporter [Flavobacterium quisquiliarum]NWK99556.1 EamA family transporter [Flavobacterium collinsii]
MNKYIIIVALGALSFGMLSSFAKIAYGEGYSPAEITLTQALVGTLILWSIALFKKLKNGNKLVLDWKLLLAGTTMGSSAYTYYLSVAYIPASLAIVLLMQITWLSILVEWIVFKKKPSTVEIGSSLFIILGTVLAGNLLELNNTNISFKGILLSLLSAILYTLYIVFTSKIGKETPMFEKSALMTSGSAMIIFLINCEAITSSTHLDFGLLQWGTFLAVFGTVIPPICFTVGMPKIGAGLSSVLLTLELPAAVFCAHIILGEKVTLPQLLGIAIMLGAIIYLNISKAKKEKVMQNETAVC